MQIKSDNSSTQFEDKNNRSSKVIPVPDSFDNDNEDKSFAIESENTSNVFNEIN